jgi:hypothetical protein
MNIPTYFSKSNFDSLETQISFDVACIKQNMQEIKYKVEVKQQMGTMTEERLHGFNVQISSLKQMLRLFNTIPIVKFYKQYRYFRYPKGKAFQDVNYN